MVRARTGHWTSGEPGTAAWRRWRAWLPGPSTKFRSKPSTPSEPDRGATLWSRTRQNPVQSCSPQAVLKDWSESASQSFRSS